MIDLASGLPELETKRLILRQLRRSDVPDLYTIFSDPAVTRYWSTGPLATLEDADALYDDIENGRESNQFFQWGIALKDTDVVVGTVTLFAWNPEHRRAELGFALASRVWNRGYGSEAVRSIVTFAFRELSLHRLEADTDPRNVASLRILEGLGFREEGYMRERYHMNGEPQDAVLIALLRTEWSDAD